jgi:hypothetical protein
MKIALALRVVIGFSSAGTKSFSERSFGRTTKNRQGFLH